MEFIMSIIDNHLFKNVRFRPNFYAMASNVKNNELWYPLFYAGLEYNRNKYHLINTETMDARLVKKKTHSQYANLDPNVRDELVETLLPVLRSQFTAERVHKEFVKAEADLREYLEWFKSIYEIYDNKWTYSGRKLVVGRNAIKGLHYLWVFIDWYFTPSIFFKDGNKKILYLDDLNRVEEGTKVLMEYNLFTIGKDGSKLLEQIKAIKELNGIQ